MAVTEAGGFSATALCGVALVAGVLGAATLFVFESPELPVALAPAMPLPAAGVLAALAASDFCALPSPDAAVSLFSPASIALEALAVA